MRILLIVFALLGCYQAEPLDCPARIPASYGCTVTRAEPAGGWYVTDLTSCDAPSIEFAAWEACAGLTLDDCTAECKDLATADPGEDWPECP
jgi:hypothetical protein